MDIAQHHNDGEPVRESEITQLNLPGKPYALYKSLALLGTFDSPGEAFAAGLAQFPDGAFSIQEIGRSGVGRNSLQAGH